MSASTINWLNGENIIVETMPVDFKPTEDIVASTARTTAALERAVQPVPYIIDLRALTIDFGQLTAALAELTRVPEAGYRHRNLKELVVVTDSPLMKIGAKALKEDQYGAINASVFENMDEALAYARSIAPAV